ncbi:MAG: hypothetical protein HZA88_10455 [Verrucomicrobia bacterium]|nr:hypothetical protein [Verrucomicrobiota bacterium]
MSNDDFEKKLGRQPMRAVPAEWRAQILREATAAVSDRRSPAQCEPRPETAATAWWHEWLWPRPMAWASLAAAWVIIAILHAATPAAPLVAQQPPPSRETMQRVAEQRRELARLLDFPAETATPQRSKPSEPRSELAGPPVNA